MYTMSSSLKGERSESSTGGTLAPGSPGRTGVEIIFPDPGGENSLDHEMDGSPYIYIQYIYTVYIYTYDYMCLFTTIYIYIEIRY